VAKKSILPEFFNHERLGRTPAGPKQRSQNDLERPQVYPAGPEMHPMFSQSTAMARPTRWAHTSADPSHHRETGTTLFQSRSGFRQTSALNITSAVIRL
jgi:hypothetical protein